MPVGRAGPEELALLRGVIERWAQGSLADNPLVAAIDRDPEIDRWYVRMRGEEKATITIWLTLRERTLYFETYFMPAPEEQLEECWEYLLRVNPKLYAWRFSIGLEDAVYLVGQLPLVAVDEEELDRVVGSGYAYTEQYFASAMRIGYATRFGR
ncbi:YbjN domain-containing protein [Acidiferrimicrobium sp. IK]|uniref:YbjN domain-containing protein n=1 Tax=Acidiferrimicrobium sp. IK TaxID=2871700 RepID=UPI0021CAF066|nr:YbjN domain-containing protein [Acidiferrimicrobium sp. IK]MCU4183146.1 YbjN domain-containing protein [Acidiferrimicrobium sp. IK]